MDFLNNKNPFIRKGVSLFFQYYKHFCHYYQSSRPTLIANSFPKSGTHLLTQILISFPNIKNYGTFIASQPSLTYKYQKTKKILKKIDNIVPSELVSAHLFYDPFIQKVIHQKNVIHYFIYRDPRDVAISEAYYLSHMNRWHKLHRYYKRLSSKSDQIMFSIAGNSFLKTPINYPNIYQRFSYFEKWFEDNSVLPIKFEDLTSDRREETIDKIIAHYLNSSNYNGNPDEIKVKIIKNINPKRSHTFRKGKAGGWRNEFTENHKDTFKKIAGNLLIKLGYEKDLNW